MIISILIFLIIFSVIVIGHEFGHYAVARRCGIRVKEFDIGMGQVIFRREGKETDFCIRARVCANLCKVIQNQSVIACRFCRCRRAAKSRLSS